MSLWSSYPLWQLQLNVPTWLLHIWSQVFVPSVVHSSISNTRQCHNNSKFHAVVTVSCVSMSWTTVLHKNLKNILLSPEALHCIQRKDKCSGASNIKITKLSLYKCKQCIVRHPINLSVCLSVAKYKTPQHFCVVTNARHAAGRSIEAR